MPSNGARSLCEQSFRRQPLGCIAQQVTLYFWNDILWFVVTVKRWSQMYRQFQMHPVQASPSAPRCSFSSSFVNHEWLSAMSCDRMESTGAEILCESEKDVFEALKIMYVKPRDRGSRSPPKMEVVCHKGEGGWLRLLPVWDLWPGHARSILALRGITAAGLLCVCKWFGGQVWCFKVSRRWHTALQTFNRLKTEMLTETYISVVKPYCLWIRWHLAWHLYAPPRQLTGQCRPNIRHLGCLRGQGLQETEIQHSDVSDYLPQVAAFLFCLIFHWCRNYPR